MGGQAQTTTKATSIEVDAEGRWDALALSEELVSFHSFLVQHRGDRWVVHAQAPGSRGEDLADALHVIEDWFAERGLQRAPCRVDGRARW